jgi:hypothetical protein
MTRSTLLVTCRKLAAMIRSKILRQKKVKVGGWLALSKELLINIDDSSRVAQSCIVSDASEALSQDNGFCEQERAKQEINDWRRGE